MSKTDGSASNVVSMVDRLGTDHYTRRTERSKQYLENLSESEKNILILKGRAEAYAEFPSRWRWFLLGCLFSAAVFWFIVLPFIYD